MDTALRPRRTAASFPDPPNGGLVEVARILVLLQGAFALLLVVELTFWVLLAGTPGSLTATVLLTGFAAAGSFVLAAGLRRHSRLARRVTFFVEGGILLVALVDLALALFLAHRVLDLMPVVTRLVMPIAIILLLHRPGVRAVFAAGANGRPA